MKKYVVLGGVSYDTILSMDSFPQPESATLYCKQYHETVGSTGSGKALCLHKLGAPVTLFGAVGKDLYGEKIIRYFDDEGLPFCYDTDPAGTERHVNLMDQEGGRISIFLNTTSSEMDLDMNRTESYVKEADYVALNIIAYCKTYIPMLRKHGKEIWCDLHDYDGRNPFYEEFIDASDYLFLSSDKLPDYRLLMERWIRNGKKLVVCTHGKEGATALTPEGQWIEVPILPQYQRVDTNGAGDNFFSGFLYAYSRGCTIETSLKAAAVTAGLCITSRELVAEELSLEKLRSDYKEMYGTELIFNG